MIKAKILLLSTLVLLLSSCGSNEPASDTAEPDPSILEIPAGSPTTFPAEAGTQPTPEAVEEPLSLPATEVVPATADVKPTSEEIVQPSAEGVDITATQTVQPPPPTETSTPASSPVSSLSFNLVADGFVQPTFLTHADDERLFVTEQPGRIRIIVEGQKMAEPFLDISERVGSDELEQGLLSVAFHPDYLTNGLFYVNYTDRVGNTVIAEYSVSQTDPNRANLESERVLLAVNQPYANHNGGQNQFGPDGYLYIGMGDGGSAGDPGNNGQNPATLLGSLLRIDVDGSEPYSIPEDNPFANDSSTRDEIWATGLRNPWRFSFDRTTGDMYIADVGQNLWEEINFQSSTDSGGANYGWRELEGTHCYASDSCDKMGFVLPVAEYAHAEGGCSVTGGYVYRGTAYPSLWGNYIFGDYCSGLVWSLLREPDGSWQRTQVAQLRANITSFGEDAAGELYVLDHYNGAVYQIQP